MADIFSLRKFRDEELEELKHAIIAWCGAYDEHRVAFEEKVQKKLDAQTKTILAQQETIEKLVYLVRSIFPPA